jgi:hypothetical protein
MNDLLCRLFPASTALDSERMSISLRNLCTVGWFKLHLVATFLLSAGYFCSWGLSLVLRRLLFRNYSIAHIINKSSWIDGIFERYDVALGAIPSRLRCPTLFRFLNDFNVMRYVFFTALIECLITLIRLMTCPSLLKKTRSSWSLVINLVGLWVFQQLDKFILVLADLLRTL